jgi:hypothetical protein
MDRPTFLAGTVAVPAVAAGRNVITDEHARGAASGHVVNRAPLRPDAFIRLAPRSTRAAGRLATQLNYQVALHRRWRGHPCCHSPDAGRARTGRSSGRTGASACPVPDHACSPAAWLPFW